MLSNETIRKKVSEKLPYRRMQHTLGVEMTARQLARLHGVDENKACTAALLHDYAKQMDDQALLQKAGALGLEIDDFERAHPDLLHGKVAARMAQEECGVTDEEILEAIACHTTGKVGMGKLAQIIYLADAIEPHRKYEGVEALRHLSLANLPAALYQCARRTVIYLGQREIPQHPDTQAVLKWFKENQQEDKCL